VHLTPVLSCRVAQLPTVVLSPRQRERERERERERGRIWHPARGAAAEDSPGIWGLEVTPPKEPNSFRHLAGDHGDTVLSPPPAFR
jgi:hypothetical protein